MLAIWNDMPDSSSESDSKQNSDGKCPICLSTVFEKSAPEKCGHFFCFKCILRWSKIKPECPLCKEPFKSVRMNFKSPSDYKSVPVVVEDNTEPETRNLLTNYFFNIFGNPIIIEDFIEEHESQRRRRLHGRVTFRRSIYYRGMYVYGFTGPNEPLRPSSPEYYRNNPSQIERIRPWLLRELEAIGKFNGHRYTQQILNSLLEYHIDSGYFRRSIFRFVDVTFQNQFIHELKAFATSVYDMFGFDEHARYKHIALRSQTVDIDSDVEIVHDSIRVLPFSVQTQEIVISDSESVVDITEATTRDRSSEPSEVILISDEESMPAAIVFNRQDYAVPGSSTANHSKRNKRRRERFTKTRYISSEDESSQENVRSSRRREFKLKRKIRSAKHRFPVSTIDVNPSNVLKMNPYHFLHNNRDLTVKRKERRKRMLKTSSDDDEILANLVPTKSVRCHCLSGKKVARRASQNYHHHSSGDEN